MNEQEQKLQNSIASLQEAYATMDVVPRSQYSSNYGDIGRTFNSFYGNRSIRSDYSRQDYNTFRPSEAIAQTYDEMFNIVERAYDKVGIVKNIIDLMADFTATGVKLSHPNPKIQQFYREWFAYIEGERVTERFCNYLYRMANVPVYTSYGKIPVSVVRKWSEAYAIEVQQPKTETRRIPLKYTFINPITLEVIAPELSMFEDKPRFGLRIGNLLKNALKNNKYNYRGLPIDTVLAKIPESIKGAIKNNQSIVELDPDLINVYYYKKDDWGIWAKPMIWSIINDIVTLEKMELADRSALDGVISSVRLWNVGIITDNPLTSIIPTKAMLDKVRSILASNVAGGVLDFVWGPELKLSETETKTHQFLGMTKYEPVFHKIYQGLGVPASMSGKANGGYNNSFISMQTLIERLKYGRSVVRDFWTEECKKIQLAMGYESPAKVQFGKIMLGDETAAMKLLIELWDRSIITDDVVQESFDFFPEVLKPKLKKEWDARKKGKIAPKAGPYYNPHLEDKLREIILQRGGVAPSEVGLELLPKKEGEKNALEQQAELTPKVAPGGAYKPPKVNGRPKGQRDTQKRKQRKALPSAKADFTNLFLWANEAQKKISELSTATWVKDVCNKKDVRSLSVTESEQLEYFKFKALCNVKPYSEIDKEKIAEAITKDIHPDFEIAAKALTMRFKTANKREPTLDEKRQIQSSSFALFHEPVVEEETRPEIE